MIMNSHYVLYSKDTDTGIEVDYMSEDCVEKENKRLAQEGRSVRWIPYRKFIENH